MLTTTDATPDRWQATAEQVLRFTLFWAPLDALPPISASQMDWLAIFMAGQVRQENDQQPG